MAAPKQGGFKMSLGGLKAKPGLKASLLQKDAKRPRLALDDDEPDDSNKQQEILGWDAAEGGALDASGKTEKKGPRVIPVLPNRSWREDAQRKQRARAAQQHAQNGNTVEKVEKVEETKLQYGLTILKKEELHEDASTAPAESSEPMEIDEKDNLTEEQRLEKQALDALLSGKSADDEHIIPVQTEEEAFQNDLREAPDAPTLEAYEATPIEGFGAALLRGMGWKDGEPIGPNGAAAKPKEVKRRPALLGIGAKEEAATGVELGEWGGKSKNKGKKVVQTYNPVTLRNKHTGELITEEELKAKLESQDMVQEEKQEKTRSRHNDDGEEDEKRREKRRDRDRDRRRDDDYDSERRRDRDRKDDRRRDKDSDYHDSDRRRETRREKGRDDDYDSERRSSKRDDRDRRRDRDRRDQSRSPDGRREKRRDRYRSRSRDSEDRRDKRRERDRRERSRSPDSDERRKRRRERDYEYDDDREERKRRHGDDKSSRK